MIKALLTPEDVAGILRISRRAAYDVMHKIPHMTQPLRVSEAALIEWIERQTVTPGGRKQAREMRTTAIPYRRAEA